MPKRKEIGVKKIFNIEFAGESLLQYNITQQIYNHQKFVQNQMPSVMI